MNTNSWFTTWIQEVYLLFFFSFHCLPDIDSSQSINEGNCQCSEFSPTSFSDPGSGGGGATERPVICNNSSLKIIHSIGRNRLPHFKIHLKHWGFEEAVVFLKNIFISKGGLCMSEFQSLLSWTRFHRRSTKSYFIVNGNAGWRKENKTQLPSDCPIKVHV